MECKTAEEILFDDSAKVGPWRLPGGRTAYDELFFDYPKGGGPPQYFLRRRVDGKNTYRRIRYDTQLELLGVPIDAGQTK